MDLNGERLIAGSRTGFASSGGELFSHFGGRNSSNSDHCVGDAFCCQARTTAKSSGIGP